jgi:hypothetical protein
MGNVLYTCSLTLTFLIGGLPSFLVAQTLADKPQARPSLVAKTLAKDLFGAAALGSPQTPQSF